MANNAIEVENLKFSHRLKTTRSVIPMNSKVRKKEMKKLDNYKKFSSRHQGSLPSLDPLVQKRIMRDYQDALQIMPGGKLVNSSSRRSFASKSRSPSQSSSAQA